MITLPLSFRDIAKNQNKNWVISFSVKCSAAAIVLSFVFLLLRWDTLPPEIPLWYAQPWGPLRLASRGWLVILPIGSMGSLLIASLSGIFLTSEYLVFTQLGFVSSFLVSILSFVTLIKILFLVTA
ncbi:MAG: hypothetical protein Q7S76_04150 [bacterium]|nr:hypothetical protein [bacterium]